MATTNKIAPITDYLRAHYPCEALPLGALTEVGSIFGVTRERVRQIANANGFTGYNAQDPETRVNPGMMGRALCKSCGKPTNEKRFPENHTSRKLCRDCQWIEIACSQCGKMKRVRTSDYLTRRSEKYSAARVANGKPPYTGTGVFCDRKCLGRWIGLHHGFAAHPENAVRTRRTPAKEPARD